MAFELRERLTAEQVMELHEMYQREWWTKGRRLEDVRHMVEESDLIFAVIEKETERLAAFARVLTDYVYKALLLDVIVVASRRNSGLGRRVVDAVANHPALQAVKHIELYCLPELMPFYRKWGFTDELGELRFMRLARQDEPETGTASGQNLPVSEGS